MEVIFTSAGQQAQEFEQTVAPRDKCGLGSSTATCHCLRLCLDTLRLQARRSHIISTSPHVQRTTVLAKSVYICIISEGTFQTNEKHEIT